METTETTNNRNTATHVLVVNIPLLPPTKLPMALRLKPQNNVLFLTKKTKLSEILDMNF